MNAYMAEFIGTALLILFGNGVVANVVLPRTKGNNGGWIVIAAGWGIAVFIGAFCSQQYSGAHINPAVSLAMLLADRLTPADAAGYVLSQMAGAMVGAVLVYLFYREHFKESKDPDGQLACFCTAPNIRNYGQAFLCELIGTYVLILPIFLMVDPSIAMSAANTDLPQLGLGTLGLLPVGMLVFGIGLSLGGTTGYAINPARDLGPRIVHALLPIVGKRDSDWRYAWVPIIGPLAGATLAALTFRLLITSP
ncbi:MIP/aquaporin family protein [Planctomycetaceae bacterium SH139]